MHTRSEQLKRIYDLCPHSEGGWFAEVYTSPFEQDGRPLAGSIYFLLEGADISHFHQIDCDEIWYFHEGCGMRIAVLSARGAETYLLGNDPERGERPMVVIPAGAIFGAENLTPEGYSFVSCATAPHFTYDGFRLIGARELRDLLPECAEAARRLERFFDSQNL